MHNFFLVSGFLITIISNLSAQEFSLCKGKSKEDFESGIYLGYKFSAIDTNATGDIKKYATIFFPDDSTNLFYNLIYDNVKQEPKSETIKIYEGGTLNQDKRSIFLYINNSTQSDLVIKNNALREQLFSETEVAKINSSFASINEHGENQEGILTRKDGTQYAIDKNYNSNQFIEFELIEKIQLLNNKFKRKQLFIIIKIASVSNSNDSLSNKSTYNKFYAFNLSDPQTFNYLKNKYILTTNKHESFMTMIENGKFRGKLSFILDGEQLQNFNKKKDDSFLKEQTTELSFCINKVRSEIKNRTKK